MTLVLVLLLLLVLLLNTYVLPYVEIVHCNGNTTSDCKEYEYYLLHNDLSNDSIIYYQGIPDVGIIIRSS